MTDKQKALEWLYKQLKRKRIALSRAEGRSNAEHEVRDIKETIDIIEDIIAVVLGGNDESI